MRSKKHTAWLALLSVIIGGMVAAAMWVRGPDHSKYDPEAIIRYISAGEATDGGVFMGWLDTRFPPGTSRLEVVQFFERLAQRSPPEWWILPVDFEDQSGVFEKEGRWVGATAVSKFTGYHEVLTVKAQLDGESKVKRWRLELDALVGDWIVENGVIRMLGEP